MSKKRSKDNFTATLAKNQNLNYEKIYVFVLQM